MTTSSAKATSRYMPQFGIADIFVLVSSVCLVLAVREYVTFIHVLVAAFGGLTVAAMDVPALLAERSHDGEKAVWWIRWIGRLYGMLVLTTFGFLMGCISALVMLFYGSFSFESAWLIVQTGTLTGFVVGLSIPWLGFRLRLIVLVLGSIPGAFS